MEDEAAFLEEEGEIRYNLNGERIEDDVKSETSENVKSTTDEKSSSYSNLNSVHNTNITVTNEENENYENNDAIYFQTINLQNKLETTTPKTETKESSKKTFKKVLSLQNVIKKVKDSKKTESPTITPRGIFFELKNKTQ